MRLKKKNSLINKVHGFDLSGNSYNVHGMQIKAPHKIKSSHLMHLTPHGHFDPCEQFGLWIPTAVKSLIDRCFRVWWRANYLRVDPRDYSGAWYSLAYSLFALTAAPIFYFIWVILGE